MSHDSLLEATQNKAPPKKHPPDLKLGTTWVGRGKSWVRSQDSAPSLGPGPQPWDRQEAIPSSPCHPDPQVPAGRAEDLKSSSVGSFS